MRESVSRFCVEENGFLVEGLLQRLGKDFLLIDPMRRNFKDREVDSANEIVEFDLQDVRSADLLLVNYAKPSIGTAMEVFYAARDLGKFVIAFSPYSYKDSSPWMVRFSTKILPTLEDIYGMVMTEAMAFGLPVITTVYCGGRELVREGVNGYICDSADIQSIVAALEKAYTDMPRLSEMGANAREVMSQFTHEAVMSRMGADLLDVLAQ